MAAPQTKRHATIVSDFAAAAQGASATPLDFTEGSIFLALAEATAGLGTWLQRLYIYALSVTRLVSSQGIWVDTFIGPFGMTRLVASAASGLVNFTRFTSSGNVVIPVGTRVATGDGTQSFQVVADPTNGAFSPTVAAGGGYLLLAGALTVPVPVQATTAGTGGNVIAGAITKLQSPVTGVTAVVNTAAFTNGKAAETDPAVKIRFPKYIASLSKATRGALDYAITALGLGLQARFFEFQQPGGTSDPNFNTVFVDDGSGAPSAELVASAAQAVNDYRAFGVRVGVFGASRLPADIQMTVEIDTAYDAESVVAAIVAALTLYINGLGFGAPLRYTRLEQIAYNTSPAVTNVTGVSLNGGKVDLVPTLGQTIKTNNVVVNPAV